MEEKRPKLHPFGHLHGGAGTSENGVTRFVNAAYLNERSKPLDSAGKVRIVELSQMEARSRGDESSMNFCESKARSEFS